MESPIAVTPCPDLSPFDLTTSIEGFVSLVGTGDGDGKADGAGAWDGEGEGTTPDCSVESTFTEEFCDPSPLIVISNVELAAVSEIERVNPTQDTTSKSIVHPITIHLLIDT
jgi:hypothetical protein